MPGEKLQTEFKFQRLKLVFKKPCIQFRYVSSIYCEKFETFVENFSHTEKINFLNTFKQIETLLSNMKEKETVQYFEEAKGMIEKNDIKNAKELMDNTQKFIIERLKKYPEEFNVFNEALISYLLKRKVGTEIYFQNVDNAKELIELCLTGKISLFRKIMNFLSFRKSLNKEITKNIDYNFKSDKEIVKFDNFIEQLYKGFFLSKNKQKKDANALSTIFQSLLSPTLQS